jgi:hypothetical protein
MGNLGTMVFRDCLDQFAFRSSYSHTLHLAIRELRQSMILTRNYTAPEHPERMFLVGRACEVLKITGSAIKLATILVVDLMAARTRADEGAGDQDVDGPINSTSIRKAKADLQVLSSKRWFEDSTHAATPARNITADNTDLPVVRDLVSSVRLGYWKPYKAVGHDPLYPA